MYDASYTHTEPPCAGSSAGTVARYVARLGIPMSQLAEFVGSIPDRNTFSGLLSSFHRAESVNNASKQNEQKIAERRDG